MDNKDKAIAVLGILNGFFGIVNLYNFIQSPNYISAIVSVVGLGICYWDRKEIKGLLCKSNTQSN